MPQHDGPVQRLIRCSRALCSLLGSLCLLGPPGPCAAGEPPPGFSRGALIRFEGPITPRLQQYLYRKLDVAKKEGADLVIIEIDSPGGFLGESVAVAERLRDLAWAHTVAYVPREAISGGAIAALGCDEIIMAPHARIGDAGPIYQGEDFLFRHAPEKVRDYLVRTLRDLAEAKDRPPTLAEAMVDMNQEVYRVKDRQTGEETFLSVGEMEAEGDPGRWQKIELVSQKGEFLTVNGTQAVDLNLAAATASSRDQLKRRYRLQEELLVLRPSGVDTAVYILNLPVVTGLLLVVGLVALYVEFSAPGIGMGGLTAALCFAIFFWSRFLGGTADWLEVVLFAAGVAFLLVELLILPGFGVAGLTGFLLLVISLILASQNFVVPETGRQLSLLMRSLLVLLVSAAVFVGTAFILSKYLGEIPVLGRLTLRPPDASDMVADPAAGVPGHVSRHFAVQLEDRGIADSPLRPAGRARFGDHYVDVVTEGAFVDKGARIKVVKISGNRVVVREVEDDG